MSSSVISANGEDASAPPTPTPAFSRSVLREISSKMRIEALRGALDAQAHQAERGAGVEDHDEDHPVADERDVHVVLLALVEEDRELFFAEELGEAARGGDVAGGERGERRGVHAARVARRGDELAVLVDEEDDLGVGLATESLDLGHDLLELLLVEDQVRVGIHRIVSSFLRRGAPRKRLESIAHPGAPRKGATGRRRRSSAAAPTPGPPAPGTPRASRCSARA